MIQRIKLLALWCRHHLPSHELEFAASSSAGGAGGRLFLAVRILSPGTPQETRASSGQPSGARSARTKYAYTADLPSRSSHWPPSEESTLSLALCTPNLLDSTLVMAGTVDTAGSSFPRKSPPTTCTHRATLNHVRFPRLA